MALKTFSIDITEIRQGVIGHQVNCVGVAGAGLALQIRKTFPGWYQDFLSTKFELGDCTLFCVKHQKLYVANLAGQRRVNRYRQVTNILCLKEALVKLRQEAAQLGLPVYLPHRLGCGHGGADWKIVSALIEETLPEATICIKPGDDYVPDKTYPQRRGHQKP